MGHDLSHEFVNVGNIAPRYCMGFSVLKVI